MGGWTSGVSVAWCALLLASCGGYRSGALHQGDRTAERRAACLDLRVTPHDDPEVQRRGWLAVRYELGNGCGTALRVDLGRARVIRLVDGAAMAPRGAASVRPALLDAGGRGGEVLAYDAGPGSADYCVELAGVAPGTEDLQPVCFTIEGDLDLAKAATKGKMP